ncbi:hypothetical protein PtA15_4A495 [Puccinia triticina]|uniref:CxC1-like cysteine cluster associated with KDZ transposases domain-containing protein n=1 Tax=Puccinia triticina TaxID=208348 RepID=A0ABY7CFN7_9BASI|nr:uncharacterized protein PtA15_4A495 [Puccinia triticina]WAQ84044.1 hypothetical protein PtA15_4A495 [Puccinia triticina]
MRITHYIFQARSLLSFTLLAQGSYSLFACETLAFLNTHRMALKLYKAPVSGTLTQRLRRMRNAKRIAAARTRFLGLQLARRDIENQQLSRDQEVIEHLMENPYEPESGTSGNHTSPDTLDDEWLTLVAPLDEDDDLDRAIEADKERWRQEAQQFNWTSVMDQLFAVYIDLKGRTKNWSGQNAYTPFVRCNCLPQEKRSRFVDMVDIFSKSP